MLRAVRFIILLITAATGATPMPAGAKDEPDRTFAAVYAKLGLTLPAAAASEPEVLAKLKELKRRPCGSDALLGLGLALDSAGYRREAAAGLAHAGKACGGPETALTRAADLFLKLGDNEKAVDASEEAVRRAPKSSYAIYLRGAAREAAGETERALADFASAIELYGSRKKSIPAKLYQAMADAYAKLGRYCEAATPIRIWVSLDPIARDTPTAQKAIADYQERGKCRLAAEAHIERYPLHGRIVMVQAEINGVRGRFVLDTGASYVSVRSTFAERARISQNALNRVVMNTANGRTLATLSRADRITVGKLQANDVPVIVLDAGERSFGGGVDGLLGMSFLSRFDVRMTGGYIELQMRRH